jgi:erythronate-4-phosphate dehydrogenase
MKIVADDKIPFLEGVLEPYADVFYLSGRNISRDIVKDADALLIRTRTKCNHNLLEGTAVKFIGTATIGFDHIDIQYCRKHNIHWTNAPGCNSSSVQQYIAAALLCIANESCFELNDKTLGIIGVCNVGSKVERFARTLGMNVLLNDPPRARIEGDKNFVTSDRILSDSDIITVHVPLNMEGEDKTWHLFNEKSFRKMKTGAWFINSSRGEVTDNLALKEALESGRLAGAVLDVWENEPDIDPELMEKVLIATPHIAGYSTDGKANGTAMVVNSLGKFFDLPLEEWYPDNIPLPSPSLITIDCKGKSDEEIIKEAVTFTYNICRDDIWLRNSPSDFEKLRGDYPLRREFTSYNISLKEGSERVQDMVKELGFKVESLKV